MICPNCSKEFLIPFNVAKNIDSYGESCTIAAPCCGKPVLLQPVRTVRAVKSTTTETEDDWGTPYTL